MGTNQTLALPHADAGYQLVASPEECGTECSRMCGVADLIEEGYDMAVRIGGAPDDRRTLCSTRFIVCASPAYLEKFGRPRCFDDLQYHACLSVSVQGLDDERRWTIDNESGHEKIPVNTVFVSNIGDSLIIAARCAVGLVYLPDLFVRQDIAESRLVQVLAEFSLTTSVSAVYPFRRHMSYKIRMVLEFLTENLALATDWRNY